MATGPRQVTVAHLVGRYIAAQRIQREMTTTALAAKAGITSQAVSGMERGLFAPRLDVLYAIADALKIEVFDLLPTRSQVRRLKSD
jgi:transcriptional regulator with XRE-family HTH domain